MDIHKSKPRLGWRIATVLGVIFGIYALSQDLDWLLNISGVTLHGESGVLVIDDGKMGSGLGRVMDVRAGSSAAAAGIVRGDILTFDPAWQAHFNTPRIGERRTVTVSHGGALRRVTLTARPSHAPALLGDPASLAFSDLSNIPAVLLGLLILARSRARPAPVLLGFALVCFGNWNTDPSPSSSGLAGFLLVSAFQWLNIYLTYVIFLAFALVLLDSLTGLRRGRWIAFVAFATVMAMASLWGNLTNLGLNPPFADVVARYHPFISLTVVSLALTLLVLMGAWWRAPAVEKQRIGLLAAAFSLVVISQAWNQVAGLMAPADALAVFNSWQAYATDLAVGVVAPMTFAYAILRHRVLDLGFALNRTLVYSVVSAILVSAFALSEWAADHLMKFQGRETNVLIDAAIALAVSLMFDRVRRIVEHAIELVFFRSWQEKAAALRKFVAEAGFVTRREPLIGGFADALARFADADCAIYLVSERGNYRLSGGGLPGAPKRIDPDDPALITLRADHKPLNLADSLSALPAEVAAPMINRNEVTGLVLMGSKLATAGYRPDEAELIGWATTQVGLDLHALEVDQLQAAVRRLEHQLEGARLSARPA